MVQAITSQSAADMGKTLGMAVGFPLSVAIDTLFTGLALYIFPKNPILAAVLGSGEYLALFSKDTMIRGISTFAASALVATMVDPKNFWTFCLSVGIASSTVSLLFTVNTNL